QARRPAKRPASRRLSPARASRSRGRSRAQLPRTRGWTSLLEPSRGAPPARSTDLQAARLPPDDTPHRPCERAPRVADPRKAGPRYADEAPVPPAAPGPRAGFRESACARIATRGPGCRLLRRDLRASRARAARGIPRQAARRRGQVVGHRTRVPARRLPRADAAPVLPAARVSAG